jgi:hypothetical protein
MTREADDVFARGRPLWLPKGSTNDGGAMYAMNRTAGRTLAAVVLTASISAAPAAAEQPEQISMPLPCTGEPYLLTPLSAPRDLWHESSDADRYHESSLFVVDVLAEPDGHAGPVFTGRLRFQHVANDGTSGAGHAVSTFHMAADLRGDDGTTIRDRDLAHITATARPEDASALIRRFFERARCVVRAAR